jgi:tryptophan 2,3-dioxygenase
MFRDREGRSLVAATRSETGKLGEARAALNPDEPDRLLRFEYDRDSDYEAELGVTMALQVLVPESKLLSADHRLFQSVHLVSEYAWCSMHHELCRICAALDGDDFGLAARLLDRTVGLGEFPVMSVRLLQESFSQASFLSMRGLLMPNSTGLDSPGRRNLRRVCTAVWRAFEAALERHGISHRDLIEEYGRRDGPPPREQLVALAAVRNGIHLLDCKTMEWNQLHLRLVRSHLGGHPAARDTDASESSPEPLSMRGAPISALERLAEHSLFPALWRSVDETYQRASGTAAEGDN